MACMQGGITAIDLAPGEDVVATASMDSTVQIYSTSESRVLSQLTGHTKRITGAPPVLSQLRSGVAWSFQATEASFMHSCCWQRLRSLTPGQQQMPARHRCGMEIAHLHIANMPPI